MYWRGFINGALVALVVVAGLNFFLGGKNHAPLTSEAVEVVEDVYWKETDGERLQQESINGIVRSLRNRHDDRFSHYFDPESLKRFNAATEGEFSGVGMTVNEVERGLRVATVYPDSPAKEGGIKSGDVIVAVDGKSLAGSSAEESASKIKGPPGTEVKLRVVPAGEEEPETFELERAEVRIPAVRGRILERDGVRLGHLRFLTFSSGAHGELREEAKSLRRRGAEGIVLDLRANGGGLLNEAIRSTNVFLDRGVIVKTRGRTQPTTTYDAAGNALDPEPLVLLVDRDTASAAEILAAALNDHGLAPIVGTRTFGKGTFQEVIELDEGGALDLTVGEFVTSEGRSLANKGIRPDIEARNRRGTDRDEALDAAIAELEGEIAASG